MEDLLLNKIPKEEAELLDKWLDVALEHGFELEVIYFSLQAMKKNPALTAGEAFVEGIREWIP